MPKKPGFLPNLWVSAPDFRPSNPVSNHSCVSPIQVEIVAFGAGAPLSIPSVLRSSSISSQWMP
jgi:hypothetical protein